MTQPTTKSVYTLDELYISPFTGQRTYDNEGRVKYIPIERNLTPTGCKAVDEMIQYLARGAGHDGLRYRYGMTVTNLNGIFLLLTGMGAVEFCTQYSLRLADDLLRYTGMTVDEVARRCGIGSRSTLYSTMQQRLKCSPTERRHQLREARDKGRYRI